jgi:hypothetical protein
MNTRKLVLTLVAAAGMVASAAAQVPSYVPTDGLVGWWPFNGNANDESGNGNDGVVNGALLAEDRFGNPERSYFFTGLNFCHISVPNNPDNSLNLAEDLTISSWFESDSMSEGIGTVRSIAMKIGDGVGEPGGYACGVWTSTPSDGFINFQASPNASAASYPTGNSGDVVVNQWYNYTVTYTSSDSVLSYYLNGSLVDSKTIYFAIENNTNELWFGSQPSIYSSTKTFAGRLDDIGMWHRALSPEEISNLYTANLCFETITVTDTLIINMGITGFNPVTYSNTIKIYPNPTNDHVTIDYGDFIQLDGYELKIINSLGQLVFETNIVQQTDYLNLATWGGNGLYFVQIIDPQGNILDIRKIVLQ